MAKRERRCEIVGQRLIASLGQSAPTGLSLLGERALMLHHCPKSRSSALCAGLMIRGSKSYFSGGKTDLVNVRFPPISCRSAPCRLPLIAAIRSAGTKDRLPPFRRGSCLSGHAQKWSFVYFKLDAMLNPPTIALKKPSGIRKRPNLPRTT
jgi:hypothetical protein